MTISPGKMRDGSPDRRVDRFWAIKVCQYRGDVGVVRTTTERVGERPRGDEPEVVARATTTRLGRDSRGGEMRGGEGRSGRRGRAVGVDDRGIGAGLDRRRCLPSGWLRRPHDRLVVDDDGGDAWGTERRCRQRREHGARADDRDLDQRSDPEGEHRREPVARARGRASPSATTHVPVATKSHALAASATAERHHQRGVVAAGPHRARQRRGVAGVAASDPGGKATRRACGHAGRCLLYTKHGTQSM